MDFGEANNANERLPPQALDEDYREMFDVECSRGHRMREVALTYDVEEEMTALAADPVGGEAGIDFGDRAISRGDDVRFRTYEPDPEPQGPRPSWELMRPEATGAEVRAEIAKGERYRASLATAPYLKRRDYNSVNYEQLSRMNGVDFRDRDEYDRREARNVKYLPGRPEVEDDRLGLRGRQLATLSAATARTLIGAAGAAPVNGRMRPAGTIAAPNMARNNVDINGRPVNAVADRRTAAGRLENAHNVRRASDLVSGGRDKAVAEVRRGAPRQDVSNVSEEVGEAHKIDRSVIMTRDRHIISDGGAVRLSELSENLNKVANLRSAEFAKIRTMCASNAVMRDAWVLANGEKMRDRSMNERISAIPRLIGAVSKMHPESVLPSRDLQHAMMISIGRMNNLNRNLVELSTDAEKLLRGTAISVSEQRRHVLAKTVRDQSEATVRLRQNGGELSVGALQTLKTAAKRRLMEAESLLRPAQCVLQAVRKAMGMGHGSLRPEMAAFNNPPRTSPTISGSGVHMLRASAKDPRAATYVVPGRTDLPAENVTRRAYPERKIAQEVSRSGLVAAPNERMSGFAENRIAPAPAPAQYTKVGVESFNVAKIGGVGRRAGRPSDGARETAVNVPPREMVENRHVGVGDPRKMRSGAAIDASEAIVREDVE